VTPTTRLRIDSGACDRCGACIVVCEAGALKVGPGYVAVDWERCDGCAKCASSCDAGAIRSREAVPGAAPIEIERQARAAAASTAEDAGGAGPRARARRASGSAGAVWSLQEAVLVLVVAFALLVGVQSFVSLSAGPPWTGIALLGYDGALVALLWYLARRNGSDPSQAYRIDDAPEWWSLPLALGVAVACWLFSVTYRVVVLAIGLQPSATEGADLSRLFGAGPFSAFLTVAAVAVIGPVLEELLLRGVVLRAASARFGMWAGIAVSALAFAALHASLWSLLPLTVLGVGLGWLASKSRSLWPAIFAHVVYNAVLVGVALYTAAR
jgi:membrane protease YdiL (CAAX protease family)/ferredoxin